MTNILIIGAGLAGLSAAREARRHGKSFLILEASGEIGGRALTRRIDGVAADLGPHWLHGEDNDLAPLVRSYGLDHTKDAAKEMHIFRNGERFRGGEDWLNRAVDSGKAAQIEQGKTADVPLSALAKDCDGREALRAFALLWNGVQPPLEPSAREFLSDGSTPGGLELKNGVGALITALAQEIGQDRIRLNTPVARVEGRKVTTVDGETFEAEHILFTGSLGVLQARTVAFGAPVEAALAQRLRGLSMGHVNKIVAAVNPAFFVERGIRPDMSLQLLDGPDPHFCHVNSGGQPLISLFIAGDQADAVELLSPREALNYMRTILTPVEELAGFADHLKGDVIVSAWSGNPYIRGAYSALLPGFERSGPVTVGDVTFCGEAFDVVFPASLAGAYRSGKAAVEQLAAVLEIA